MRAVSNLASCCESPAVMKSSRLSEATLFSFFRLLKSVFSMVLKQIGISINQEQHNGLSAKITIKEMYQTHNKKIL